MSFRHPDLRPLANLRRLAFRFHPATGARHSLRSEHPAGEAGLWDVLLHPADAAQLNQRNVLIDGIGVGLANGIGTYLSVFLVRLGASSFLVGLLTAMPALTGMLLAIPIGEFLSRQRYIVPWFSKARLFVILCYALTGLVPFLFRSHPSEAIILIWALATLPQTIVSVAFTVVMGAVAGQGGRFTLMSRRWSILGLANAITVLGVGQALNLFGFPFNYQVVFLGSAVGGLISYIFSSSIRLPAAAPGPERQSVRGMLAEQGHALRNNRPFVHFLTGQFLLRWGLTLTTPLFPLYWVRAVNASDQSISAINSTQTLAMMVAYFFWARASQRKGVRWVLLAASLGIGLQPLLTMLTHNIPLLVLWSGLAGLFQAGVDLVLFDVVLSTCPAEHQPVYVGLYQTTIYIATFLAPLLGTAVADAVGIGPALALGGVLRLAGFVALWLLKVGQPERRPAAELQAQPADAEPA